MSKVFDVDFGTCCVCRKKVDSKGKVRKDDKVIPLEFIICEDCGEREATPCRFCDEKKIKNKEFRDLKSLKENRIVGTCQKCQDDIFNRCRQCSKIVLDDTEVDKMDCYYCGILRCLECQETKGPCCEQRKEHDEKLKEIRKKESESDSSSSSVSKRRRCVYCGEVASKACRQCGAFYCSRECQRADWKKGNHKKVCKVESVKENLK